MQSDFQIYISSEINILATLKSKYIIEFKEVFYDDEEKVLCIVTEFCDAGTLKDLMEERQSRNKIF